MEANNKALKLESIDFNEAIRDVLATYEFHFQNKGFTYSFDPKLTANIRANGQALVEVIVNLIDNAIKYSNSKKHIDITTSQRDRFGCISIRDHGVGISKQGQKHVFDKFYRVSSGDLAKSRGTGLGLSLLKEIVEGHGGSEKIMDSDYDLVLLDVMFPHMSGFDVCKNAWANGKETPNYSVDGAR